MTGFFHFYNRPSAVMTMMKACQCPMTGFFHFYLDSFVSAAAPYCWCQCPMTGFFHFYDSFDKERGIYCGYVSMPYDGLFSFLQTLSFDERREPCTCQCPMTGFFHFYFFTTCSQTSENVVSMPYDGLFSFLRSWWKERGRESTSSVNALWRAFFISTNSGGPSLSLK